MATERLYLEADHLFENDAVVIAVRDNALAFDRSCFYPGGGGQPSDTGTVTIASGERYEVSAVEAGDSGVLWHMTSALQRDLLGQSAHLAIDRERRFALTRYHTVLHVLNTIALRDYSAWITGVQIGLDYSRIDFKWEGFSPGLTQEIEQKVNEVLDRKRCIRQYYLPEEEFRNRPDLLRTLEVKPPVIDGRVRIVAIEGFDEQACGGTHVDNTADAGRFTIFRTENKGRINKRLYVRLC